MTNPAAGRILALDLGTRTIGLAVSDETQTIAQPLRTILRQPQGYHRDLAAIRSVVEELEVALIVVGLPLTLDGNWGTQARRAARFAETLHEHLGLPVALQDERLTTCEAEEYLKEGGVRRADWKQHVDALAASLLLRDFLAGRQTASP